MFTDLELIDIHASLLFTYDSRSRLLFVNEPNSAVIPAPRLFLGRTQAGNIWWFRADLPEKLCEELHHLCGDEPLLSSVEINKPPLNLRKFVRLLGANSPILNVYDGGPAYCFTEYQMTSKRLIAVTEKNSEMLKGGFEKLIEELPAWQPFVAHIEENRAVSICRSVRITTEAHEAGVETLPNFRGRGYAKEVTAEWARLVQAGGAIPLYSTSWGNNASQVVAQKLKLRCYGVDFEIL